MPIQPMNFISGLPIQGNPLARNLIPDFQKTLADQLAIQKSRTLLPFVQPTAEADLLSKQQENQWNPKIWQSEIGLRGAQTNKMNTMTPLEATELGLKNRYYGQSQEADIAEKQARAKYLGLGGGRSGAGVTGQAHMRLQQEIGQQFPHFTPEQTFDAANAYLEGRNTLSDGTPLPPATGLIASTLDVIAKQGTTSALLTQQTRANQAEAELSVLSDYAQKGLKPYGDTIMNKSPQQIVDTFKSDKESQLKLGKLIGAQALGYEAAQNRIRLANGQPGVTSTEELMRLSGQQIDTRFPMLSQVAREEAARFMDEGLRKGLEARKKVGIRASAATSDNKSSPFNVSEKSNNESSGKVIKWVRDQNGKLVRE